MIPHYVYKLNGIIERRLVHTLWDYPQVLFDTLVAVSRMPQRATSYCWEGDMLLGMDEHGKIIYVARYPYGLVNGEQLDFFRRYSGRVPSKYYATARGA